MNSDRDDHLFLTRLDAADLADMAHAHATKGDEISLRVAQGLLLAAQCRYRAELRAARSRSRRAAWLGLRREWRRWCQIARQPVGPLAHRMGDRLRERISAITELV